MMDWERAPQFCLWESETGNLIVPVYVAYLIFNFCSLYRRRCICSWHCLLHRWHWRLVSEDLLDVNFTVFTILTQGHYAFST